MRFFGFMIFSHTNRRTMTKYLILGNLVLFLFFVVHEMPTHDFPIVRGFSPKLVKRRKAIKKIVNLHPLEKTLIVKADGLEGRGIESGR